MNHLEEFLFRFFSDRENIHWLVMKLLKKTGNITLSYEQNENH